MNIKQGWIRFACNQSEVMHFFYTETEKERKKKNVTHNIKLQKIKDFGH